MENTNPSRSVPLSYLKPQTVLFSTNYIETKWGEAFSTVLWFISSSISPVHFEKPLYLLITKSEVFKFRKTADF